MIPVELYLYKRKIIASFDALHRWGWGNDPRRLKKRLMTYVAWQA